MGVGVFPPEGVVWGSVLVGAFGVGVGEMERLVRIVGEGVVEGGGEVGRIGGGFGGLVGVGLGGGVGGSLMMRSFEL